MHTARLENRYLQAFPASGLRHCRAQTAPAPRLVLANQRLAGQLGIPADWISGERGAALWTGNACPPGAVPIALAYAGHQFGVPVACLGDGRALLLGQLRDSAGRCYDLQLKGAGATPFSRGGDGLAALGPALREYLVSEAMAALGIATSRALAVALTGTPVKRQSGTEPGAVLTRVASSHLRFGSFEFHAHRGDIDGLRCLAEAAIDWHFPALREQPAPARYRALLRGIATRTAILVSEWLRVGFIHGVMNTDNMTVSGETLDYGPCAFMDQFRPDRVYSSVDRDGRYAWNQQPRMAHWNLARLAECLLPLLDADDKAAVTQAETILAEFPTQFALAHNHMLARKLGLARRNAEPSATASVDGELGERLLALMARYEVDFTNTWRLLMEAPPQDSQQIRRLQAWLGGDTAARAWMADYAARLEQLGIGERRRRRCMASANPVVIPRNHRIETALAAARAGDMAPARRLAGALRSPYRPAHEFPELTRPPEPAEIVPATFCGT